MDHGIHAGHHGGEQANGHNGQAPFGQQVLGDGGDDTVGIGQVGVQHPPKQAGHIHQHADHTDRDEGEAELLKALAAHIGHGHQADGAVGIGHQRNKQIERHGDDAGKAVKTALIEGLDEVGVDGGKLGVYIGKAPADGLERRDEDDHRDDDHEDALQKVGPGNGFEAADIDQNDGEQRERHNDNGFIHAEEGGEQGDGALVLGNDEQNVEDGAADAGPDAQEVAIVPLAQEIRDGESAQGTGIGAHAAGHDDGGGPEGRIENADPAVRPAGGPHDAGLAQVHAGTKAGGKE